MRAKRFSVCLIVGFGLTLFDAGCSSAPSAGSSQGAGSHSSRGASAPLPPARKPPAVGECSVQLEFDGDGNASPLVCHNGAINILAWNYFATIDSPLLGLGRAATEQRVERQLCADLNHSTVPIERSAYTLARAYYGWKFGARPVNMLVDDAC
ncbi:MAG: hypothetical protein WBA31_11195 [Candidatus Dormiibacterota bacterium]